MYKCLCNLIINGKYKCNIYLVDTSCLFFFHFQRIFHSHLTFSIIENNNYTTIIVILLVVVVVVVIVQRLKMAVISINLRNAISLIKKKKSDNLTTISGNINTLCLLSNSRTIISVYSPIKHGREEKRTF